MARILGFINGVLRGKLGGQVFSANASGEYVRQYVKPVNPNTQAQATARGGFSTALSAWHSLDASTKTAWAVLSTQLGLQSGINAFMSLRSRAIASNRLVSNALTPVGGDETLVSAAYDAPLVPPSIVAPPFSVEIDSISLTRDFTNNFVLDFTVSTIAATDIPAGTYSPGFGITAYISNIVAQESHFLANPEAIKFGASEAFNEITAGVSASTALSGSFVLDDINYKMLGSLATGQNYARISLYWESIDGQRWLIGSQTVSVPPPIP